MRMRGYGFRSLIAFLLAAFVIPNAGEAGWEKHHKSKASGEDPCAAPRAYVSNHISQIRALQASAPETKTTLFEFFGGQKGSDEQRSIPISELRYDADGVNALLQAGGCQAFDLERELTAGTK